MSAQPEIWRVSTIEGVFETDFDTLQQWIVEGAVLPSDKVSKGTLSWIEAGRVPKLKGAFNGEVTKGPIPDLNSSTTADPSANPQPVEAHAHFAATAESTSTSHAAPASACHNHADVPPDYVCRMCGEGFCSECQRFASGKTPLCPLCGDLCYEYKTIKSRSDLAEFQTSGFGLEDFKRAVVYPFQHKGALLGGALLYGLLLMSGFRGSLVAWMIMFGCISHVINQVAWGRIERSFMPDFSDFSFWEDLVMPLFLGIGITVVSWGPMVVLMIALIFGVVSSGGAGSSQGGSDASAAEASGPSHEDLSVLTDPNADPKKLEEANQKLNETRPGVQLAREAEQSKAENNDPTGLARMVLPYLGAGIVLVGLLLLTIAWAVFYYPMALTVAGYTQSLGSVLNPLVGLDTIRRMGATYFKAFGMVIAIQIVALIVGVIVSRITAPFALPWIGNLPANFINGTFTFYFNLVIACLLGLSLFKSADRLGININ